MHALQSRDESDIKAAESRGERLVPLNEHDVAHLEALNRTERRKWAKEQRLFKARRRKRAS